MSTIAMQPEFAVSLRNVEKKFGHVTAIHSVSLGFEKGTIIGLIGCNGSGKTVLMKMICGLMRPTRGTVEVMGAPVTLNRRSKASIGAIIETPGFLPEYTGYRNLKFLAGIKRRPATRIFGMRLKRLACPARRTSACASIRLACGSAWELRRRLWSAPS